MTQNIVLDGVRVHNLKGIHVEIPLGRLTVVTGVSGAGKSSLVFDTLYAEAQRRYLQSFSAASRQYLERFDRPDAESIGALPPAVALRRRAPSHGPRGSRGSRATVGSLTELSDLLHRLLTRAGVVHCVECGQVVRKSSIADVLAAVASLPSGTRFSVAFPARPETPPDLAAWAAGLLEEGLVRVQIGADIYRLGEHALPALAPTQPVWVIIDRLEAGHASAPRLTESLDAAFARGNGRLGLLFDGRAQFFDRHLVCPHCGAVFPELQPRILDLNDPRGACPGCAGSGIQRDRQTCPECHGRRWNRHALAVRLLDRNIAELSAMTLAELRAFFGSLAERLPQERAESVLLDQVRLRLNHLTTVDLGHLMLLRPAETLSGGMTVRARLATALAANLAQALYLIEEPTADLHPRDIGNLIIQLRRLRDVGNTVVVVEHQRDVIGAADYIIDLGPGAGEDGGRIIYAGTLAGLAASDGSTAEFFAGRQTIAMPARRRSARGALRLSGASTHNLQGLTVEFPLGLLCVVTGVGGAGKRSLVEETLYPALLGAKNKKGAPPSPAKVTGAGLVEDVIRMDQQPLPRSSRSNPATYLKIFDEIREVFAATAEAKIRNFGPGHFSFNQPGGRCERCEGQGSLTVDMQFLADVAMPCPECQGRRYRREVLDVKVRGLNIAEVLELTVREAFRFFRAQPAVERRLRHLLDVGLDYLRLGQPADTLSGGESQRLKLAGHLAASKKPRCLFLLIEPSAGLHPSDVAQLLGSLDRLLAAGHSLVLVEHDLDVILAADHIIDLGPDSGSSGGTVVAAGTPEQVAQVEASATGRSLRSRLAPA
jgi:excinuclease ABC subunit A